MNEPLVSAHKLMLFVERIEHAIEKKPMSAVVDEVRLLRRAVESVIRKAQDEKSV